MDIEDTIMSQKKIIQNVSGTTKQILNRDVANGDSYDVPPHLWSELAIDTEIHNAVTAEEYIINNEMVDLVAEVGLAHLQVIGGVVDNHSDITLLPAVTENAPAVIRISDAAIGFDMDIGTEIFGHSRINNYAGNGVNVQLHMAINNTEADRWIQFNVHYITTNGRTDKQMNSVNGTLQMGPVAVPTTAWRVFEEEVTIPSTAFDNGEVYIYIGVERVEAVGKTAPTNNPVVLRYCKKYWERLES